MSALTNSPVVGMCLGLRLDPLAARCAGYRVQFVGAASAACDFCDAPASHTAALRPMPSYLLPGRTVAYHCAEWRLCGDCRALATAEDWTALTERAAADTVPPRRYGLRPRRSVIAERSVEAYRNAHKAYDPDALDALNTLASSLVPNRAARRARGSR